jgi:hypothetical protein
MKFYLNLWLCPFKVPLSTIGSYMYMREKRTTTLQGRLLKSLQNIFLLAKELLQNRPFLLVLLILVLAGLEKPCLKLQAPVISGELWSSRRYCTV